MNANALRRRSIFAGAGYTAAAAIAGSASASIGRLSAFADPAELPVTGKANEDLAPFDRLMTGFLKDFSVPGGSLAVTRGGQVVYARGFGFADTEARRPVEPTSLFRIASVSKPLTAIAVLQLARAKKISLDTEAFDLLPARRWLGSSSDRRIRKITIRHLLQHRGGWDRDAAFDPIGRPGDAVRALKKSLPASAADITKYALRLPLDFDPGSRFAYSNVGYLLLGRLIEQLASAPYETVVRENVLRPAGVTTMTLGRARAEDAAPGEVRYYDRQKRIVPAVNGPKLGVPVPLVYGGENFEGYEAHGGWIGSAIDLVRFASAVDAPQQPLITPQDYRVMIERPEGPSGSDARGNPLPAYYGCGWNVRPVGSSGKANIWHNGLIAGTSALLVRRHDGLNWAVLFNTDRSPDGKVLANLIDPLIHQAADAVRRWPEPAEIEPVPKRNTR